MNVQQKVPREKVDVAAERALCHSRARWICERCGMRRSTEAHHVLRRGQGGPDTADNLKALCDSCHLEVHNATGDAYTEGWLRRRFPRPGDWHYSEVDE